MEGGEIKGKGDRGRERKRMAQTGRELSTIWAAREGERQVSVHIHSLHTHLHTGNSPSLFLFLLLLHSLTAIILSHPSRSLPPLSAGAEVLNSFQASGSGRGGRRRTCSGQHLLHPHRHRPVSPLRKHTLQTGFWKSDYFHPTQRNVSHFLQGKRRKPHIWHGCSG